MANPSGSNQVLVKIYESVWNAIRVRVVATPSFSTISNTRPSVSNTSAEILAANSSRKYAYVFNNTGATVYIKLGATAVVNQGFQLGPNESFEINSSKMWTGSITAIKATATSINLDVAEGT